MFSNWVKAVFSRAFAVLVIVSPLVAQVDGLSPNQVATSRPLIPARIPVSKPAEVLQFASAKNGVDAASAKPWHVKLTYDQFDEHGSKIHSGSAEEHYVSAKKYRLSFTTDEMSQTDVANESGLYRNGEQRWLNPAELQVLNEALRPFYRLELKVYVGGK